MWYFKKTKQIPNPNLASTILILVLLPVAIMSCSNQSIRNSPEELAKTVYLALHKNNVEIYNSIQPQKKDAHSIGRIVKRNAQLKLSDPEQLAIEIKNIEQSIKNEIESLPSRHKNNNKKFRQARNNADNAGLDWENSSFSHAEYKIQQEKKSGLLACQLYFYVDSQNKQYKFQINDCLKVDQGWVNGDGLSFLPPD